jgi:hypothetical protein
MPVLLRLQLEVRIWKVLDVAMAAGLFTASKYKPQVFSVVNRNLFSCLDLRVVTTIAE